MLARRANLKGFTCYTSNNLRFPRIPDDSSFLARIALCSVLAISLREIYATMRSVMLLQQRLGLLQNRRVETFGEPAVDRREQIAGFDALALIPPKTGEATSGVQLV
jgi:hypothetical protein